MGGWGHLIIAAVLVIIFGWICYMAGCESQSRRIRALIDTIIGMCVELEMTWGETRELIDSMEE